MFNPLVENGIVAISLNALMDTLNAMNESYPRRVGTMVMISDQTENEILVNEIAATHEKLAALSDDELGIFVGDVDGYREFLDDVAKCIDANRREIHDSREFLARYYSY